MIRLDSYLVEEGYYESRNRALEAIKSKKVSVDGKTAKASQKITPHNRVEVINEKFYVSRAARKLEMFLRDYPIDLKGKRGLDIGSSTGGFAQILLENGVTSLTCVDVGKDQLHISLRKNDKITLHEETDIRDFIDASRFDLVTCDVSFISILQIIESIDRLSIGDIIILYKPQFEVGREVRRDSRGVVQDADAIARRKEEFEAKAITLGWRLHHHATSHITGKEGNVEFLYYFAKTMKEYL